jgi:hypothetical protein
MRAQAIHRVTSSDVRCNLPQLVFDGVLIGGYGQRERLRRG